jgi:hypothetical protein
MPPPETVGTRRKGFGVDMTIDPNPAITDQLISISLASRSSVACDRRRWHDLHRYEFCRRRCPPTLAPGRHPAPIGATCTADPSASRNDAPPASATLRAAASPPPMPVSVRRSSAAAVQAPSRSISDTCSTVNRKRARKLPSNGLASLQPDPQFAQGSHHSTLTDRFAHRLPGNPQLAIISTVTIPATTRGRI